MALTHALEQILYMISSSLYLPVLLIVTLLAAYSVYTECGSQSEHGYRVKKRRDTGIRRHSDRNHPRWLDLHHR
ncbi:hypothetical protein JWZ98_16605 [Methylomonas sp. EFPC1]|uniref:hypothetical protein n=1 Tax=Methylomonas sp. EFPC1 TaxID=2812647 RepID=UPI0019683C37|nr:hypothetical protein [Methylomonas sp. EFPC1]QSB00293.1 hypothetical protein JWZ98_16605 [Methylomonas sp. EFPC1]